MAYTRRFEPDRYDEITMITSKLPDMSPGEKFIFRGVDDIAHIKWLLYDWLHHMGFKKNYTLYEDHTTLTIRRKGLSAGVTVEREAPPMSGRGREILKEMITSENPVELVTRYKDIGDVNIAEMGELLVEYNRVMS